jgi:hypothetical protein
MQRFDGRTWELLALMTRSRAVEKDWARKESGHMPRRPSALAPNLIFPCKIQFSAHVVTQIPLMKSLNSKTEEKRIYYQILTWGIGIV